jgi:23S rRNA (guanosine2251-2'-O)-methyltransferase
MSRRPNPPQHRKEPAPHGDFVMGRNCADEILKRAPERIIEAYVAESRDDGHAGRRKGELLTALRSHKVRVREVPRRELDNLVHSDSHQGVVLRVEPRRYLQFPDLLELVRESRVCSVLALDGIVDPQNFGTILRAAECFGVNAVVWSKNRGAPLGPVVSKVSVGASEIVPLCPVSNLHRALEELKQAGAWSVGAIVSPDATALDSFQFPEKTVLVMGAEGEGIHQLIDRSLDFRVYITMRGEISSLNVSQASSVMLHELSKQHGQTGALKVT